MTIKRAEFLVLVAVVTSAAVMQFREGTLTPAPQPSARRTAQTPQPTSCGVSRLGVVPAGCEVKRDDERRIEVAEQRRRHEPRLWV